MRFLNSVRWAVGALAVLVAGAAAAAAFLVEFPEVNGPPVPAGPFPQPPLVVATRTFAVPAGERVVSASISGFWGSSGDPNSTAGVNVLVDGITVAQCVKPDPACWTGDVGQRPWSHTFTEPEMTLLNDGSATMTAVQTSDISIRLGVSTLLVETAPQAVVPTLSPLGLLGLIVSMAVAGAFAVRRLARA